MGFKTMFMTCFEIREQVMDVLQAISGNRVNYAMNRIGGVNRDIEDPQSILGMVEALEKGMTRTIIPIFTTSKTATSRCAGIGVLTTEKARSLGVVGPVARASGIAQDLRKEAPYAAYAEMDFAVPVVPDGDVRARLLVRALEIMESCKILRQALTKMPAGEIAPPGDGSKFSFHHRHCDSARRGSSRRGDVLGLMEGRVADAEPRTRSHAHLREYAVGAIHGPGSTAGRHAAHPSVGGPLLLVHGQVELRAR